MDSKKFCEAAMLGGALVLSMAAMEAAAYGGCTAGSNATVAGATTNFVKSQFITKCSANVDVEISDNGSAFGVQGRSAKGKTLYGGSSEGGSVSVCTTGSVTAPAIGTVTATAGC